MLTAVPLPGGGALLQLQDGAVLRLHAAGLEVEGLSRLPGFPEPCPHMRATPAAAHGDMGRVPSSALLPSRWCGGTCHALHGVAGMELPLALGLSCKGHLYWGSTLLRVGVSSFGVRSDGAGGPFLLAVTRDSVLHTLPFSRLLGPQAASEEATAQGGR